MTWRPRARRRRKTAQRCEKARAAPDSRTPPRAPWCSAINRSRATRAGASRRCALRQIVVDGWRNVTRHSAARESRPRVPRRRRSRTRPGRGETAEEAGRDRRSLKPRPRRRRSAPARQAATRSRRIAPRRASCKYARRDWGAASDGQRRPSSGRPANKEAPLRSYMGQTQASSNPLQRAARRPRARNTGGALSSRDISRTTDTHGTGTGRRQHGLTANTRMR